MSRKKPESNDVESFTTGSVWNHATGKGTATTVQIVGRENGRIAYRDMATGHIDSSRERAARARSRFWPADMGTVRIETPAPLPFVLNGDGATVTLEGHTVAVYMFRGRPCVIAADLGRALGYASDGKGLVESIAGWSELERPRDYGVLKYTSLREFKLILDATARAAVGRASHLTILYETGMDLACQKAQTPAGERLRRYLADDVLPKLRRGEAVRATPAPVAPAALPADTKIDRLLDAVVALVSVLTSGARLPPTAPVTPRPALVRLPPRRTVVVAEPDPAKLYSPTELAAFLKSKLKRLDVTAEMVGKTIKRLGFWSRTDLFESENLAVGDSGRIVGVNRWRGVIWPALLDAFGAPPAQSSIPGAH